MSRQVAVILSGCGVYDGSEIQEAVATLYALEKRGIEYQCFAPDIDQLHTVNHLTGEVMEGETRKVLVEAARICRGNILPIHHDKIREMDGYFFVGGFGAAKNLSDYAINGSNMAVEKITGYIIQKAHENDKPIAALCISPVLIASVLKDKKPKLTLGENGTDSNHLETLGAEHIPTTHEDVIVDEELKIISSPCYMLDANISQIFNSADNVVKEMIQLFKS